MNFKKHGVLLLLLGLTVLGGLLRTIHWDTRSLWQDEVFSVSLAMGNPLFEATILPETVRLDPHKPQPARYYRQTANRWQPWEPFFKGMTHNIQMPLYPLLMRGWGALVGADPVLFRVVSMVFGTLCIPVAFLLGRALAGNRLGLFNALIFCLSGFQLIYSQTARVYVLLVFLVLLSAWLAVCLSRQKQVPWYYWLAYGLVSLLGLYSHYYYSFIVLAQGLFLGMSLVQNFPPGERLARARPLVLCFWLLGMAMIPWLDVLKAQVAFLSTIGHGNLEGLWNPLSLVERLWSKTFSLLGPHDLTLKLYGSLLVVLGVWGLGRTLKEKDKQHAINQAQARQAFLFLGLWLVVVLGALIGLDWANQTHRIYSERYLILIAPVLYLLVAYGLLVFQNRWQSVFVGLLVVLLGMNAFWVLEGRNFLKKEDYRSAGRLISRQASPGDLVVVSHAGVHAAGISFYLPSGLRMLGISRPDPTVANPTVLTDQRLRQITDGYGRVWVVLTHVKPRTFQRDLVAWFDAHGTIVKSASFNGVKVLKYTLY